MKTSAQRSQELTRRRSDEAALEKHVAELFRSLPMLAGFAVRDDFEFDDVSVYAWPGYTAGEQVAEAIVESLAGLADERPGAARLIAGRTFARAFH